MKALSNKKKFDPVTKDGTALTSGDSCPLSSDQPSLHVLGDIGNLVNVRVVEGKTLPPVNRPITRSFGAQLLANAQAATTAAADKKPVVVPADRAAVVKVVTKATKKVTVKPKPEKVTEINPDKKPKEEPESSSLRRRSSRKKVNTLTKVLTARSKMEHNSCHFNCMQRYGPVYLDHSTTVVKVPVQHG